MAVVDDNLRTSVERQFITAEALIRQSVVGMTDDAVRLCPRNAVGTLTLDTFAPDGVDAVVGVGVSEVLELDLAIASVVTIASGI